jgi:hypothetical protein
MPFNSNFDSPLAITGGGVTIKGASAPFAGGELVARSVALEQSGTIVNGDAGTGPDWASRALDATGLRTGDALALGSETYLVRGDAPAFVTATWSQVVTLVEA